MVIVESREEGCLVGAAHRRMIEIPGNRRAGARRPGGRLRKDSVVSAATALLFPLASPILSGLILQEDPHAAPRMGAVWAARSSEAHINFPLPPPSLSASVSPPSPRPSPFPVPCFGRAHVQFLAITKVTKGCGAVHKNFRALPHYCCFKCAGRGSILVYSVEWEVKKYSMDERICV
ncbi:hypothetical protein B0H14DRAFT_2998597 [Mycena olivaceomarginata]|nr:hypothetical protein B0H14DRAFT_2998597 [Mycena olivaceomarginata]